MLTSITTITLSAMLAASTPVFTDSAAARDYITDQITACNREVVFLIDDNVDPYSLTSVFGMSGNTISPDYCDGDYIREGICGSKIHFTEEKNGSLKECRITAEPVLTLSEALKVDEWVKEQAQIFRSCDSEHDRLALITEYISEKMSYKVTQDKSLVSAIEGSEGQCLHYALLLYRLGKESGLDVRVMRGTSVAENKPHEWCIVKVDGNWYHCDPTLYDTDPSRNWLLLGDKSYSQYFKAKDSFEDLSSLVSADDYPGIGDNSAALGKIKTAAHLAAITLTN